MSFEMAPQPPSPALHRGWTRPMLSVIGQDQLVRAFRQTNGIAPIRKLYETIRPINANMAESSVEN